MSEQAPDERRAALDKKIREGLERNATSATVRVEAYAKKCTDCRMFVDSLIREFVGSACVYDYGLIRKADMLYCPTCNRCAWSGDS